LAAAREGQIERLLEVLHPEVTFIVHSPNGQFVTLGATEVATRARVASSAARGHAATVSGTQYEPPVPRARPYALNY
jgi:RNA polymerase sigma-70 factor (ECF subfamily)